MQQTWAWAPAGETGTHRERMSAPAHSLVGERGTKENVGSALERG